MGTLSAGCAASGSCLVVNSIPASIRCRGPSFTDGVGAGLCGACSERGALPDGNNGLREAYRRAGEAQPFVCAWRQAMALAQSAPRCWRAKAGRTSSHATRSPAIGLRAMVGFGRTAGCSVTGTPREHWTESVVQGKASVGSMRVRPTQQLPSTRQLPHTAVSEQCTAMLTALAHARGARHLSRQAGLKRHHLARHRCGLGHHAYIVPDLQRVHSVHTTVCKRAARRAACTAQWLDRVARAQNTIPCTPRAKCPVHQWPAHSLGGLLVRTPLPHCEVRAPAAQGHTHRVQH